MQVETTAAQARAIIGAMACIAATDGEDQVTAADRTSLEAAYHYLLRQTDRLDLAALPRIGPEQRANAMADRTLAMHPALPLEGHILPVIFSWHLGIRINDVAGAATGALDPSAFWQAWAQGAATRVDLFAPGWDFWAAAGESLVALRQRYGIPPPEPAEPDPV